MDFVNLREKYILTCYETGNKHATSIMEKTFKKKIKNKIFIKTKGKLLLTFS